MNTTRGSTLTLERECLCQRELSARLKWTPNVYQLIPFAHVKENLNTAVACAQLSKFGFNFFEQEKKGDKKYTEKSLEKNGDYFFCLKSLSIVPVDEQGCLDSLK